MAKCGIIFNTVYKRRMFNEYNIQNKIDADLIKWEKNAVFSL